MAQERLPWGTLRLYAAVGHRLARSHGLALGQIPAGAHVLDLGCGPGQLATRIATLHPTVRVTAVDLDPRMLALARRLHPPSARLAYQLGDAAGLPLEDASFDLVWASASFHHFADAAAALRECSRVLRPGGQLWIFELRSSITRRGFRAATGLPALPGLFALARWVARRHGLDAARVQALAALAARNGFSRVDVREAGAWAWICAQAPA